jgi:hypothetical protein
MRDLSCRSSGRLRLPALLFATCAFLGLAAGCVSIPKEAPELSGELGKRIGAMETAHLGMVRIFMDTKRAAVDEFMMREWVPAFSEEVMKEPIIRDTWEQICKSGTAQDRVTFLTKLGPRFQAKINAKRVELIQPLDQLEATIERRLRDEYAQMESVNNAITSFLASAAKVAANRDRYLNMLGVSSSDLANALDKVESATSDLVSVRDAAVDKVNRFNTFKTEIGNVIKSLQTGKN